MHVRMARMSFTGDVQELAERAEAGMLPIFQAADGFKAYSVAVADDEVWSLSVWETADAAEAANDIAAGWVAANLSDQITVTETHVGELLISTTLGVSPARV
jgi:heme-degrading monooxygenase HmoA